jgi:hypothetical protein
MGVIIPLVGDEMCSTFVRHGMGDAMEGQA